MYRPKFAVEKKKIAPIVIAAVLLGLLLTALITVVLILGMSEEPEPTMPETPTAQSTVPTHKTEPPETEPPETEPSETEPPETEPPETEPPETEPPETEPPETEPPETEPPETEPPETEPPETEPPETEPPETEPPETEPPETEPPETEPPETEPPETEPPETEPPETEPPETEPPETEPPETTPPEEDEDAQPILKGENETEETTIGIDVSKYQGVIDWQKVSQSGIDFVMVRVGYRTLVSGEIMEDHTAKYNMQQAQKYGIKIGVYFFSAAVSEAEAIEEANWVADFIAQYSITYPVAYDCEGFDKSTSRHYGLTKGERTDIALAFLKTIGQRGYTPMFYGSKNDMQGDAQWETSRIEKLYKVWVAQYPALPYPQTGQSSYTGVHGMWQYTDSGKVYGVEYAVDMNVAYFGYSAVKAPQDPTPPPEASIDWDAMYEFQEVNEEVTALEETNLRDIPSTGGDSTVLYTLKNGEIARRIGISEIGWSKLEFNGKIYYAVTRLLTTDLTLAQE